MDKLASFPEIRSSAQSGARRYLSRQREQSSRMIPNSLYAWLRGRSPLRVIVDSGLKIPAQSKVFRNISLAPKLLSRQSKTAADPQFQTLCRFGSRNDHRRAPDKTEKVDLKKLFKILAERKISSILIEGGAEIITSVLKNNLANRLVTIIAPKITGSGIEAVGDLNIRNLGSAKKLTVWKVLRRGDDIIYRQPFHLNYPLNFEPP